MAGAVPQQCYAPAFACAYACMNALDTMLTPSITNWTAMRTIGPDIMVANG